MTPQRSGERPDGELSVGRGAKSSWRQEVGARASKPPDLETCLETTLESPKTEQAQRRSSAGKGPLIEIPKGTVTPALISAIIPQSALGKATVQGVPPSTAALGELRA